MATGARTGGQWRQARVGALLIVGLLVLAYGIFQVGSIMNIFADRFDIYTVAPSAGGLTEGSPVHLAGQRVGQVDEIVFLPPGRRIGQNNLVLKLSVAEEVKPQLRRNSIAFIRSVGLLGDKIVDIQPGTMSAPVLQEGDTLPSNSSGDLDQIIATGAAALDSLLALSGDLRRVTTSLSNGEGTMGRLLTDRALYDQMVGTTGELRGILVQVNRSDGTLSRLIHDPALYHQFSSAVARVDTLTLSIVSGRGSLGRLLRSDTLYTDAAAIMASADSAVMNLNQLTRTMVEGRGTLHRLFTDPALYDQFLKSVIDLQTLIAAIRENPKLVAPTINVDVF